jgi:hypothetical protein
MRKWFHALLVLLVVTVGYGDAVAQQIQLPRDYAVVNPIYEFSPDNSTFSIKFTVRNTGSAKPEDSTIRIINLLDNSVMSQDVLPPIGSGGNVNVNLVFITANFAEGQLPIEIQVGIDQYETADSPIADNNIVQISIPIPSSGLATNPAETPASTDGLLFSLETLLVRGDDGVSIQGYYLPYETVLFVGATMLIVLIALWVFSIIVRSLTRKDPDFNAWQPSYANMPIIDPNSTEGRRQAWQTHAQNSIILAAPTQGTLHAIKVLMGTNGETFANWTITGIRISQYDNYGRVSRTQVVATRGLVKQLNGIVKRRKRINPEHMDRPLRRIANQLVQKFKRNLNTKSAFLPVALDLRMEGKHGEVRILFELYQAQAGMWYRLDQWEPAMAVATRTIQESFTFTIHGMSPSEKMRDYNKRLVDDTTWLLTEMLRMRQAQQTTQTQTHIPDTLTDMKPMQL